MYLPANNIAAVLGYLVKWDKSSKSLIISGNNIGKKYLLNTSFSYSKEFKLAYFSYSDDFELDPNINNNDISHIKGAMDGWKKEEVFLESM